MLWNSNEWTKVVRVSAKSLLSLNLFDVWVKIVRPLKRLSLKSWPHLTVHWFEKFPIVANNWIEDQLIVYLLVFCNNLWIITAIILVLCINWNIHYVQCCNDTHFSNKLQIIPDFPSDYLTKIFTNKRIPREERRGEERREGEREREGFEKISGLWILNVKNKSDFKLTLLSLNLRL